MGRLRNGVGVGISNIPTLSSRRPAFTPLSLFADGSQGVWYDDSLTSSMYQDSAGTTAAALESPVGLQLDLSQGLALGSELVTNGTFVSDVSGWTAFGQGSAPTFTWTANGAKLTNGSGTYATAYQAITTVVGKWYKVTGTIISHTSASFVAIRKSDSGSVATNAVNLVGGSTPVAANTSGTGYFLATATTTYILAQINEYNAEIVFTNISCKSIAGNHRFQATSANRPTLSARYNLLTKTEQFNNAAWTVANVTVVANAAVAPDGTTTADKIYPNTTGVNRFIYQTLSLASGLYKWSFRAKAAEKTIAYIDFTGAGTTQAFFNLTTGAVGTVAAGYAATITSLGDGWYECSGTNNTASTYSFGGVYGVADVNGSTTVTANGTDGIYIWGGDTRPANQATGLIPTYQRVDTSSVYDTVGFPQYLKYNGSNSSLSTASINFTATAQINAFMGVRRLVDVSFGVSVELSAAWDTNNGTFSITNGAVSGAAYRFGTRGAAGQPYYENTSYVAPLTNTLSSTYNLAGATKNTSIIPKINNVIAQSGGVGTTPGGGNFGTYPMYFGARAGTSFFFNGQEYQTIIVGKTLTATEISNTETYVNSKTKAY